MKKQRKETRKTYDCVFFHKACQDGAVAAWTVWRSLPIQQRRELSKYRNSLFVKNRDYRERDAHTEDAAIDMMRSDISTVFIEIVPQQSIRSELVTGKDILFLDSSPARDQLADIVELCRTCTIRDHHETLTVDEIKRNMKAHKGKLNAIIEDDPGSSGAVLGWELIFPDIDVPDLVKFARIHDNKQWDEMEGSKEISAYLNAQKALTTFPRIEEVFNDWDEQYKYMIECGSVAIKYAKGFITRMAAHYSIGYMQCGARIYKLAYLTGVNPKDELAEAVRRILPSADKDIAFVAIWNYNGETDTVTVSLRSPMDDISLTTDVVNHLQGTLAAGGHPEAASFRFYGLENLNNFIERSMPLQY